MDSIVNGSSQSGISRRTVVAGAAWAAPAIMVAGAVPAFALSGGPPKFKFVAACKLPGGSCHIASSKFGYKFTFEVTNNTVYPIFICDVNFSDTGTQLDPLVWVPPLDANGDPTCIEVGPSGTYTIKIFAQGEKSPNTSFTTTMTSTWAHNCPCQDDPDTHHPVAYEFTVSDTPPKCDNCD